MQYEIARALRLEFTAADDRAARLLEAALDPSRPTTGADGPADVRIGELTVPPRDAEIQNPAGERIEGSDAFSYDYGRDGSAVEVYGGRNDTIVRNVAVDDHAFTELGNPQSAGNTYAYDLFVSRAPKAIFLVTRGAHDSFGPVQGTRVYNTTAVLTGKGSQGVVCYAGCSPDILRLRNDVVVATGDALQADGPLDEAANVFWGHQRGATRPTVRGRQPSVP